MQERNDEVRPPDVWGLSWSGFRVHGCSSPQAFDLKLALVPKTEPPVLRDAVAVFIDILRATTTLVAIAAAGADGIYLKVKPRDRRFVFAPPLPTGEWVYGGEQYGGPIRGESSSGEPLDGIIDNSPLSVRGQMFRGKRLLFFSSNGANAVTKLASAGFRAVYAASIPNISATLEAALATNPSRVWIVCGGFHGSASLEDSVASGILIQALLARQYVRHGEIDDEALGMLLQSQHFARSDGSLDERRLIAVMQSQQVIRLISPFGHASDAAACVSGDGMSSDVWESMRAVALFTPDPAVPFLAPQR